MGNRPPLVFKASAIKKIKNKPVMKYEIFPEFE
jgi:hypothetical protein